MNNFIHAHAPGVPKPHFGDMSIERLTHVILLMKLTMFLILAFSLSVSATATAQKVSLRVDHASMPSVLKALRKQSGYAFVYNPAYLRGTKPVTLNITEKDILEALPLVFAGQPVDYTVNDKVITIVPKPHSISGGRTSEAHLAENLILAYPEVRGRVVDSLGNPLVGASVRVLNAEGKRTTLQTKTDGDGYFELKNVPEGYQLEISYIGHAGITVMAAAEVGTVMLQSAPSELEEVEVMVNTGYQQLPKERATGSFVQIDNDLLERSAGFGILQRLEGITNGLYFDMAASNGEPSNRTNLRIRGLSTINGESQPLIVLDNFPYEGDIDHINPNDVESITVLKDAAASSIWGARAANGVIVITTKKPSEGEHLAINFTSNLGVSQKPNLFYDPGFIPSPDLIDLEISLYNRGIYRGNDGTEFSPIIDMLFARDEGKLTEDEAIRSINILRQNDIRKDAERYLYRSAILQQHSLSMSGRTNKHGYVVSAGYDKNLGALNRQNNQRFTLNAKSDFYLTDRLEWQNTLNYVNQQAENNGVDIKTIAPSMWSNVYTYAKLRDDDGNALPIVRGVRQQYVVDTGNMGLLDWLYRPMDELAISDNTSGGQEIRLSSALKYDIMKGLTVEGRYQYQHMSNYNRRHYLEESFFVRNLINRYTQPDDTSVLPYGGILDKGSSTFVSHSGRAQATYEGNWYNNHRLNILAGLEIREDKDIDDGSKRLYGYDDNLLISNGNIDFKTVYRLRPNASGAVPNPVSAGNVITERYLSYYGNVGYSYRDKYLLSGSMRWDGSNIFGVDFNQKGVPLWSLGVGWNLEREDFVKATWIDRLKIRATYGANGNIVRSQSALPYVMYGYTNVVSAWLAPARIGSVGNPSLSWEKVKITNLGVDFSAFKSRITGSVEWFIKKSENLIGADYLDPTSGIIPVLNSFNIDNYRNYANMRTHGVDVEVASLNTQGKVKWRSVFLVSYNKDKVTNYYTSKSSPITSYLTYGRPAVRVGAPRDQIYAIPWNGLSTTGDPLVRDDNGLNTDYVSYFNGLTFEDLLPVGVSVAPYFGSIRNTFDWNQLSLSFNLSWRAGHKFRRESVSYESVFAANMQVHEDYLARWQKTGDENKTNVPALPTETNRRRDQAFLLSEALIEDASSIRLKDIQVSYQLNALRMRALRIASIRFNVYARNLGVVWKATKSNIDPDVRSIYPQPFQINFGLQANF